MQSEKLNQIENAEVIEQPAREKVLSDIVIDVLNKLNGKKLEDGIAVVLTLLKALIQSLSKAQQMEVFKYIEATFREMGDE